MIDVLVTGAETHQGIVVIRSLGRKGIGMLVTGDAKTSKGFYSRYATKHEVVPSSISESEAFVDSVLELVRLNDIPYIYPVTESSMIALDLRRDKVDAVAGLIAPPSQLIRSALDKKKTLELARKVGIETSKTSYPNSSEEAVAIAEEWGYPVVLKPRADVRSNGPDGGFEFKAMFVKSTDQLRAVLKNIELRDFPMMQDFASGPQTCFHCFVEKGSDAHSFFQDDMVRMLPMWGGVGARRLSRPVDDQIREQSKDLFRLMNWEGCAQTQWKGPGKDGLYKFLEVTVRLPASVGSPVASGIDMPWLNYRYFTGQSVKPATSFVIGKHSRWFKGDTVTVFRHLTGDMPESGDPLPTRRSMFFSWLYDFIRPGLKNDVESFTDPMPGLVELKDLMVEITRLLSRRAADKLPVLRKMKRSIARHGRG